MYDPKGNSKDKGSAAVRFEEALPPPHLRSVVHRYLHLSTTARLRDDYRFHALPDACTYLVLDQQQPAIAGVARLQASAKELNLGRTFHFVNIRLLPGTWQGARDAVTPGLIDTPYTGDLPLQVLNASLAGLPFPDQQALLTPFIDGLVAQGLLVPNPLVERIFTHMDDIHTVADMADIAGLSPRQLQRVLKDTTGFAPHNFLKILRLQQSLLGEPSLSYADQSHFIHAFKKATGYTPGKFAAKFDV